VRRRRARRRFAVEPVHLVRDEELRFERPAEVLFRQPDLVGTQRRAVRGRRVLLVRRAVGDVRAQRDQRRPRRLGLGRRQGGVDGLAVVAVVHALHVPAVGLETHEPVLGERQVGGAVDADVVVVVEDDQLAQGEVPGERGGLGGDALHQVAVAGDHVGVVVDDLMLGVVELGRQVRLGDRHADGVPEPLAQGPGRRLDTGRHAALGMSGRPAAPLAERAEVVEREVVAGQMQHGVEQHAGVPGGEHEAVAVGPSGVSRVVAQMPGEEDVRRRRQPHGGARMTRTRLLHGVDGQEPDRVDAAVLEPPAGRRPLVGHAAVLRSRWSSPARRAKG